MQRRFALRLTAACVGIVVAMAIPALAQRPPRPRPPRPPARAGAQQPGQQPAQQAVSPPALKVNGQVLTQDDLTRFAWTRMGKKIILDVLDETLIIQAAHRAGIVVTGREIDKRITELAELAGGIEKLVAKRGVAGVAALRAQVKAELLLAKLVEAAARVTEKEARAYYEAHKSEFMTPTRVLLYEIVTEKPEAAYNARQRLAEGEPFTKVAAEVSVALSAQKGGEVGWVALDEIEPEVLRRAVATLQVGQVSMPILIKGKSYIVMVKDKQPGQVKPFEEVKEDIIARLKASRGATPKGVLMKLRRQASVEILVPPYKYIEEELAEAKRIKVVVNGEELKLKASPVITPAGRIIVPAKAVFKALGCRIQWVGATKLMIITRGERSVRVTVGSDVARVDGKQLKLGEKAQMRDGTVWVPPRPVAEALGIRVHWDPAEYVLSLKAPET